MDQVVWEGGQRRALASPSAVLRGLRAPGKDGALQEPYRGLRGLRGGLTRVAVGCQYSSARMIVSTRVVTAGSAGSGEPNSVARS